MSDNYALESILAADCGTAITKVVLIDVVDGEYRFVARAEAPTTAKAPWSDITIGIRQAINDIQETMGRQLLDANGQLITPERADGNGIDVFVAITSAAPPLQLVLAGLSRDLSLASARRAAAATYAAIRENFAVDGGAKGHRKWTPEAKIEALQIHRPDAVLIAGGTDGGAMAPVIDSAEIVAMACSLLSDAAKPCVIFAGNVEARPQVAEILGSEVELRVTDNVRPTLKTENTAGVQQELDDLYCERMVPRLPGINRLGSWSPVDILPTAKTLSYTIRYMSHQYRLNVVGLDVGATSTVVASVIDNFFSLTTRTDVGMGYTIGNVLARAHTENVLRWLPFEMDATEANDLILNKELWPCTIPQTGRELLLEQAVAREALRLALGEARRGWREGKSTLRAGLTPFLDLIIGSGGTLIQAPHPGQAALILLDALQPIGVCTLALDALGLAAPVGAVATVEGLALAAAQVAERDAFVSLGTVIAPVGTGRDGEIALRYKIVEGYGQGLEGEVPFGSLSRFPLGPGQKATLELRPTRRFDIGVRRKGKGATTEVEGGVLGVIIDARGRPLILPDAAEKRRAKMQRWLWDMGIGSVA